MSDQSENQETEPGQNGIPPENQDDATPNTTKAKRTAEQQVVIDRVAQANGREWAERHADRIIWESEHF